MSRSWPATRRVTHARRWWGPNFHSISTSTLSVHKLHDTSMSEPFFMSFVLAYLPNLCTFRINKAGRFTFYQDLEGTRMTSEPQKDIGPHPSMLLPLGSTPSIHMKSDFHCQKASEAMPASATAKKNQLQPLVYVERPSSHKHINTPFLLPFLFSFHFLLHFPIIIFSPVSSPRPHLPSQTSYLAN